MPIAHSAFTALGVSTLPSNTHIFASQHLLGTVALMVKAFRELGAADIHVLGKCYSTLPAVHAHLRDEGFKVEERSVHFDSHEPFDRGFAVSTHMFCEKIKSLLEEASTSPKSCKPNVVVMDDGGMLLEKVNDMLVKNPELRSNANRFFGVEQTSSGANRLYEYNERHKISGKGAGLRIPVHNVARSRAKLTCESPLISYFTLPRVLHHVAGARRVDRKNMEALVIGGGPIGLTVSQRLDGLGIATKLFDRKSVVESSSADGGCRPRVPIHCGGDSELIELISSSNLIIGATGKTSVTPGMFPHFQHDTSLISISSSDREFSACDLRQYTKRTNDWNKSVEVVIPETKRSVTLGYSGFPLTFDDHCSHAGEPEEMQLTMALLIASVLDGLTTESPEREVPGMINVGEELQDYFIAQFNHLEIAKIVEEKYGRLAAAYEERI
eukprot:CAMPEP_0114517934 /NCGR_PEP_ID=MMETSP0109-20121206/18170_1 /TAXON_ID=29199 /ORGANISM="Chlorarachnion reptans, Strain CCCM449" /LENGTH=440 /DNA_ID=CAMNT_0001698511 /DNA_START=79 /DNA_END=1401 /DNA_ORIENTATION=-